MASEIQLQILNKVFELEIEKGHLQWRISDLARAAKVSRPLVYYHFGHTKTKILEAAVNIVGEDYCALSGPRQHYVFEGKLLDSLLQTRRTLEKTPALVVLYQKTSFSTSELKHLFALIDRRYQEKLIRAFPHLSLEQIRSLHAILHGLITAPFMSDAEISLGFTAIANAYSLQKAV